MSSTTDPEDRRPRHTRADDGTQATDARIHDARQDGAPTEHTAESPAVPAGTDTRVLTATREGRVAEDSAVDEIPTRQSVVAREKEQFGGIQIGAAFFGWLTATGTAVLLTALVAAAGTAVGLATNSDVNAAANQASSNETVGIVGIIVLLVILFVAYYCGGYVAGRMARFNGAKQGFMVWIWARIAAVVVAALGFAAGQQFNILASLNSFPRIPINEGQLSLMSIIAAIVVAVVALLGAVLGGLAGMHFHRKVDRAGFAPVTTGH